MLLPHYFRIEACFVSEVIIDRGDIRSGAITDLSDRSVVKAQFSKHFSRCF